MNSKLVLASGSPRRKELLRQAGFDFDIVVTDADETLDNSIDVKKAAAVLAVRKAKAAVPLCKEKYKEEQLIKILAADTTVVLGNRILGKPQNEDDAFEMLSQLSNRWHSVFTAVAVANVMQNHVEVVNGICQTEVHFNSLSSEQIKNYIKAFKPFDKAGSYGIQDQDGFLVKEIKGDYNSVVGLPVYMVREMLNKE